MNPLLRVIGIMSGTSLDGIDLALVEIYETRGDFHISLQQYDTYPLPPDLKEKILRNSVPQSSKIDELTKLNFELGELFAGKVLDFCREHCLKTAEIDLIGSHGQTIYHYVEGDKTLATLQLGEPSLIAQRTGITTVADFRPADVALGGKGAPLVPFVDIALFHNNQKNIALQNIGGIGNVTYIPAFTEPEKIIAFDTGPGNVVIDTLLQIATNGKTSYDDQGKLAATGKVNQFLLDKLMSLPYFSLKPPKSSGRELFNRQFCQDIFDSGRQHNICLVDLLATVTFFTAKTIHQSYLDFLPILPDEIILSGGGCKNLTLKKYLQELFGNNTKIVDIDKYGIAADAKEAVAFAVLAYCTVWGISNNLPAATGASQTAVMGKICPGANFWQMMFRKEEAKSQEATETRNLLSEELDLLTELEIVELMNKNDLDVIAAIDQAKDMIALTLTEIIQTLEQGGRLFYIGAGTSGRLGVLDASECPPTFKTPPELVQGIIAGGKNALTSAIEGAEDSAEEGAKAVSHLNEKDILIGISANGRAPYVLNALEKLYERGGKTILITCNQFSKPAYIKHIIRLNVGPEVLSGSTRLKAGTATKMVLNIFTTGAFAKLGKVYKNYMVDLNVSNTKLKRRSISIIMDLTGLSEPEADEVLRKANNSVKLAILMQKKNLSIEAARILLENNKGFLRKSLLGE